MVSIGARELEAEQGSAMKALDEHLGYLNPPETPDRRDVGTGLDCKGR
jgi:hypothetical protein